MNHLATLRMVAVACVVGALWGCKPDERSPDDFRSVAQDTLRRLSSNIDVPAQDAHDYYAAQFSRTIAELDVMHEDAVLPVSATWRLRSPGAGTLEVYWVERRASIKGVRIYDGARLVGSSDQLFRWSDEDHAWFKNGGLKDTHVSFTSRKEDEPAKGRATELVIDSADVSSLEIELIKADGTSTQRIRSVVLRGSPSK